MLDEEEKLIQIYNLSREEIEKIQAPTKLIVSVTHIVHTYSEIEAAGFFGSRTDVSKPVSEDSDYDILLKLQEDKVNSWGKISYDILNELSYIDDKTKIDIAIFNHKHVDPRFKQKVLKQLVIIKGNESNFNIK